MVKEGFERKNPYCSGVVELEEGAKITARILGLDLTKPERIKIGASVSAEYIETKHEGQERTLLGFRAIR